MSKYLGLLQWSLATQQEEAVTKAKPMDEERRRWLMEAIEKQVIDPVEEMKNVLELLKIDSSSTENREKKREALVALVDYVDNYDLALDFYKIGGVSATLKIVEEEDDVEQRISALQVLSLCVQNHENLQLKFFKEGILKVLVIKLKRDVAKICASIEPNYLELAKLVSTVGSCVRGCPEAAEAFLTEYKTLPDMFVLVTHSSSNECSEVNKDRVLRKVLFLFRFFVDTVPSTKDIIKAGLVSRLEGKSINDIQAKEIFDQLKVDLVF